MPAPISNIKPSLIGRIGKALFGGTPKVMALKIFLWGAFISGVANVFSNSSLCTQDELLEMPYEVTTTELNCDKNYDSCKFDMIFLGRDWAPSFYAHPPVLDIEEGCGVKIEESGALTPKHYQYKLKVETDKIEKKACDAKVTLRHPDYPNPFEHPEAFKFSAE